MVDPLTAETNKVIVEELTSAYHKYNDDITKFVYNITKHISNSYHCRFSVFVNEIDADEKRRFPKDFKFDRLFDKLPSYITGAGPSQPSRSNYEGAMNVYHAYNFIDDNTMLLNRQLIEVYRKYVDSLEKIISSSGLSLRKIKRIIEDSMREKYGLKVYKGFSYYLYKILGSNKLSCIFIATLTIIQLFVIIAYIATRFFIG